jgi:deoxyhypusine synthase
MARSPKKQALLQNVVRHLDIKKVDVVPLVDMMAETAFSARDLARAGASST